MATRKQHSPEQIVRRLIAADRLLAEGKDTGAVFRGLGVSEATYHHRWRNQFGGPLGRGRQTPQGHRTRKLHPQTATRRCGVVEGRAAGYRTGKLLGPERRRAAVRHLQLVLRLSERFACRVTGQHRASQRHEAVSTTPEDPDATLRV